MWTGARVALMFVRKGTDGGRGLTKYSHYPHAMLATNRLFYTHHFIIALVNTGHIATGKQADAAEAWFKARQDGHEVKVRGVAIYVFVS